MKLRSSVCDRTDVARDGDCRSSRCRRGSDCGVGSVNFDWPVSATPWPFENNLLLAFASMFPFSFGADGLSIKGVSETDTCLRAPSFRQLKSVHRHGSSDTRVHLCIMLAHFRAKVDGLTHHLW